MDYETLLTAAAELLGIVVVAVAGLRGWQGWLDLKTRELDQQRVAAGESGGGIGRIELADLRERVRKLEAIAAGVDL